MGVDPWLDRWLDLIKARAGTTPVLELGCGPGIDTATLTGAGLRVVAFDKAEAAVIAARKRAPAAVIEVRDLLDELPLTETGFNVVLASLSLHYFHWKETIALFAKVRAALNEGGLFVCRVNSTEDHEFGARGYPKIEPNFYLVNGRSKRFFTRRNVETLMRDRWRVLSLEDLVVDRYDKPKALWELVAEASDACS
jgi:SAM-dependent methyltransferase